MMYMIFVTVTETNTFGIRNLTGFSRQ